MVRHPLVVIVAWLGIAAVMWLSVPSLAKVAEENPPEFMPSDAPVLVAGKAMANAFHESGAENMAVIVLTNEAGLGPADEATYRTLVDKLRADTADVHSADDFVRTPELRQVVTSADNKAWNLPVYLAGEMSNAEGQQAYRNVVQLVTDTTANSSLSAHLVGAAATFDDLGEIGARDQHVIEIATVLLVLTILVIVYRNLVAMILPLATIGISLVVAQQAVAGLGELGLGVAAQTMALMTAMMLGAGTDYAIFLLSRYHECIRSGLQSDDALVTALASIGKVMAGSAGTVAIAFLGMAFTKLGVFSTVGPALAVTVIIGFLASATLLPALIVLAGRRGWVQPRRDLTGRIWRRSGVHIVRRPRVHLLVSLCILIALAGCATLVKFNYDDQKNLPADAPSKLAYEVMSRHFPDNLAALQFIVVQSPKDLRDPKALADLEQMAHRVSQLPDIAIVRGITRPTGQLLEEAKATAQAGEVGRRLQEASKLIADNDSNLTRLSGGAHQLSDVLGQIRNSVVGGIAAVRPLVTALTDMQRNYGGNTTLGAVDKTTTLVANMRSQGEAIGVNIARIVDMSNWATPLIDALNVSPVCDADPACAASRADLQRIVIARNDGTIDKLAALGRQLQGADGTDTLDEAAQGLSRSLDDAIAAARNLTNGIEQKFNEVEQGANLLADSSSQLADGVQTLVDQTRVMGSGLDQASAFLLAMKRDAAEPAMSGFYIPPEILTQDEFKKAASLFVSEDGHTVRYLVQTELEPFSTAAMDQVDKIREAAESARPNTTLSDATISMVGGTEVSNNIRHYYDNDILFIICITLLIVFLILAAILRAIVAPLYLVLSVILSYASALGIGVIFFQFILGQEISWSTPGTAFLVLVAVGADYNLLLISRIRDESHRGLRSGVIRTVGATGGVITSAGLIFAASMLGLTLSNLSTVVQMGFIIGVGLLLDTFLVRTVTVPALAVLFGKANWWPSKAPAASSAPVRRRINPVEASMEPAHSRIELISTIPALPDHNHLPGALRLPLFRTSDPPKLLKTKALEAPGRHATARETLHTDNHGYWLIDPQTAGDLWQQYQIAAEADVAIGCHRAIELNGGPVDVSHRRVGTRTRTYHSVRANLHRGTRTTGSWAIDTLQHRLTRVESPGKLLTTSVVVIVAILLIGPSSEAPWVAVRSEQVNKMSRTSSDTVAAVRPDLPTPVAQVEPLNAESPPVPPPPAQGPIDPLSTRVLAAQASIDPAPAGPVAAAPDPVDPPVATAAPAAPRPTVPVARDSLRFAPEPIAQPTHSGRNRRNDSGSNGSAGGGTGTGGSGTGGTGTGGTGTGGTGTGGTGSGG